jgi:hypothetical protein
MENPNPYQAPQGPVGPSPNEAYVPEDVMKKIKNACGVGLFSGGITLLLALIAISGTSVMGFTGWELIDAGIILGLTFGLYRKSRVCAVLLFVFFVGNRILMLASGGPMSGLIVAAVFAYALAQGILGTFEYHKWTAKRA